MKNRTRFYVLTLFLFLLLSACAEQGPITGEDPVMARFASATLIYDVSTLSDLPEQFALDTVVVATPETPGECEWISNGEVLEGVGPVVLDMRDYGALMDYKVTEVIKGDPDLLGATITVCETLYKTEDGKLNTPFCIGENADNVVLCLHKSNDGTMYYNHIAEYFLMHLLDDGTLEVWPYLNRTRAVVTLDSFKAMFE